MSSQPVIGEDTECSAALSLMDVDSSDRDMRKAFSILEPMAASGDSEAQYVCGLFMYTGTETQQDKASAVDMIRISASSGNIEAVHFVNEYEKIGDCKEMDDLVSLKFRAEQRDVKACSELFNIYDNGKGPVKKDHAIAVRYYTVCAEKDDVDAMDKVGFMYLMGKGVDKDKDKALYWLKKAAQEGDGLAMYRIGYMYETGQCYTEPDLKEAAKWYTFGADAGNKDAQYAMGGLCCIPKTRYHDTKRAADMFRSAADQGHPEAAHQIGMMYAYGEGVGRDVDMAIKYLEKSCEGGYQQAMTDYGNMRFEGQVIPKDVDIAAKWFEEAAKTGNGYAQYALACMYGNGVHYEQSDEKAAECFREASEMGEVNSQYCFGCFCYEGRGCPKDPNEAKVWFGEAADQGHPAAKSFLGMMMVAGKDIDQDLDGGMELLKDAADNDKYYEAQYYLGKIYMDGKYVEKNIPLAKKYLGSAAKQGDPDASALLNRIKVMKMR